jgi:hypothetical protein
VIVYALNGILCKYKLFRLGDWSSVLLDKFFMLNGVVAWFFGAGLSCLELVFGVEVSCGFFEAVSCDIVNLLN